VSESSSPNAAPSDGIVARPPSQLHDLPIRARWEVTRRNPYYLVFWAQARAFRLNQLSDDSVESYLQFAAHLILSMMGPQEYRSAPKRVPKSSSTATRT
jgi:hypothetical protein